MGKAGDTVQQYGAKASASFKRANAAVERYKRNLVGLDRLSLKAVGGNKKDALSNAMAGAQETRGQMNSIVMGAGLVSAAITGMGAVATKAFSDLESSATRAAAIATGGGKEFSKAYADISKASIEFASRTKYSATEAAQGMTFLAMAGMNATQAVAAMPAVMRLAAASGTELAQAADTVTNIAAGFQIKLDGSAESAGRLAHVNDVLVATLTGANVNMSEMGEAMKVAGPIASTLGRDLEETAAAIGILGNAGIKGSDAGTGLKRAMSALVAPSKGAKKAFDVLGVSMDMVNKEGLVGLVKQLEIAKMALGDSAFTGKLFEGFGERAGPKLAALVGQGSEALQKLEDRLKSSAGIAKRLEEKEMATLAGQMAIVKSNAEAAMIQFGQLVAKGVAPLTKALQAVLQYIADLSPNTKKLILLIGGATGAFATFAVGAAGLVSVLLGVKVAMIAATSASMGFAGTLAAMLGPALALAGAALAGLSFGVVVAEWRSGKDMLATLSSEFSFATESAENFLTTMKNLGLALASVPFMLGEIVGIDISGWFADMAGSIADANTEMNRFDISSIDAQITSLNAELDKLAPVRGQKILATVGGGRQFFAGRSGGGASTEDLKRIAELNKQIADLGAERIKRTEALTKARKDQQEADAKAEEKRKKAAAEAKKAAEEKARAMRKEIEAIQKRNKALQEASATAKRARKTIEQIAGASKTRLEVQQAGDLGEVVSDIADFQRESDELAKAFKVLGEQASLAGKVGDAQNNLRGILIENVKSFLRSKQGAEDFADVMQKTVDMLNAKVPGLAITAQEVSIPDAEKQLDFSGLNEALDATRVRLAELEEEAAIATSAFPPLTAAQFDAAKKIEAVNAEFDKAAQEASALGLTQTVEKINSDWEKATSATIAAETRKIAAIVNSEKNSVKFNEKLEAARLAVEAFGGSVADLDEKIKAPSFMDVERVTGLSLGQGLASVVFDGIKDMFTDLGKAASASDAIGDGLASLFGQGGGGGLGSTVGAAFGAAFGAPQIGAAIGGGIESLFNAMIDKIGAAFDAIAGMIPEQRLSNAASAGSEFAKAMIPAALVLAPFNVAVAALLPFLALLAGFFGSLATQTKGYARMMDAFATVADQTIEALEPLTGPAVALAAVFSRVVEGLTAFIPTGEGLNTAVNIMFNAFKVLGVSTLVLSSIFGQIFNALTGVFKTFVDVVFGVMGKLLGFLGEIGVPVEGMITSMIQHRNAANLVVAGLETLAVDTDSIGTQIQELMNLSLESAIAEGNILADMQETMSNMSSTLTNAPEGFKESLERFRAIRAGEQAGASGSAGTAGVLTGGGTVIGVVNVYTEDPDRVVSAIQAAAEEAAENMAGSIAGRQFNPGFG